MKEMNLFLLAPILAGWVGGYVVNYLADVLPAKRKLVHPACPQCSQYYNWGAYFGLRDCPNCHHNRGLRPWATQILMLAISLYTWFRPQQHLGYVLGLLLLIYFGVVIVIDIENRLILHPTSIVGALLGFGLGTWSHGLVPTMLGGLGGFVIMLVFYYLGVLFSKLRARRLSASGQQLDDEEALGAGDVILAGILGLILGWPLIWFGLLLGILLGGAIGIVLMLAWVVRRQYSQQALMVFMPYGPFFVASTFILIFLPNWIVGALPK